MTLNLSTFRPARLVLAAALGVAVAAGSLPAGATSYVMVSDVDLTDQAAVIAEVHIVSAEPSPADTLPATDYQVDIDRVLKGTTGGSSVVVRVPGGMRADGRGVKIWGAPEFAAGERALLFLAPRADGTYTVLHLMLGAFHVFDTSRGAVALRNLADAEEVKLRPEGGLAGAPGRDLPRNLARFSSWVQDQVRNLRRPADYFVELPAGAIKQLQEKFTTFLNNGLAIRWFEFDRGGSIDFAANESGQPGLAGGGFTEFQNALLAWNNFRPTHIRYNYVGTTSASGGLTTADGVNAILFADPHGEISTPFTCRSGGILAHGGPWFDPSTTGTFNGRTFIRTQEADIVTNKGIECFFSLSQNPSKAAEELFGHELGHTLGLGHSCGDSKSPACESDPLKNDALMRTFIHDDGRGARLGGDDMAGIESLYQPGSGSPSVCRADQNTLCLLRRRFAVTVNWQNQYDNSSGVGRAVPRSDSTGFFSFGDPSNIELLVKILDFGNTVKVFYGELTNLHFSISVLDTVSGDVKTYINTTGDCGGIDQAAFPSTSGAVAGGSETGAGGPAGSSGLWISASHGGPHAAPKRVSAAGSVAGAAAGSCRPGSQTLCLLSGRFAVSVTWSNPGNNTSGTAGTGRLSDLVGTFFFTDSSNVELMTKMIDFGDHIAVFYGALSDLPYTITVTDTRSGQTKTYQSTAGKLCGGLDDHAF
jgi:hypothetical protein